MSLNIFLLINFVTYIFTLKIFFYIFKTKYYFPFRYADFFNFLFNLFFFAGLSLYCYNEFFWVTIFINLNLFYIFFHLINMIITSPRTKLIIDLKSKENSEISISQYLMKYNCKVIVNNRIKRLKTSGQIVEKNKYFTLKKDKKNFLYIISLVFSFIEKI